MPGGKHYYPGVQLAVWNVTEDTFHHRYFSAKFWNYWVLLPYLWHKCNKLPVKLPRPLRDNTSSIKIVICCFIQSFMIPITVNNRLLSINRYFSICYLRYLFSFSFPVDCFFLPWNTLNLMDLIKNLWIGISTTYPNHHSRI